MANIYEQAIYKFGRTRQLLLAVEAYTELSSQLIKTVNQRLDIHALGRAVADATIGTEYIKLSLQDVPSVTDNTWMVNENHYITVTKRMLRYTLYITEWVLSVDEDDTESSWNQKHISLQIAEITEILNQLRSFLGEDLIDTLILTKLQNLKKSMNNGTVYY